MQSMPTAIRSVAAGLTRSSFGPECTWPNEYVRARMHLEIHAEVREDAPVQNLGGAVPSGANDGGQFFVARVHDAGLAKVTKFQLVVAYLSVVSL